MAQRDPLTQPALDLLSVLRHTLASYRVPSLPFLDAINQASLPLDPGITATLELVRHRYIEAKGSGPHFSYVTSSLSLTHTGRKRSLTLTEPEPPTLPHGNSPRTAFHSSAGEEG